MFYVTPKSLVKCRIRICFIIEIVFTTRKKNICINFNQHMSNTAKNNPDLQHLKLNKLDLSREYTHLNNRYYFNNQKIILERDSSANKSFFESSIGFVLDNLLERIKELNKVEFFIKSEPIILSVNDNFSCPVKQYYCSNTHVDAQNAHKKSFANLKKILKSYKKRHALNESNYSQTFILNSDYDDEQDTVNEIGTNKCIKHQDKNKNTKNIISQTYPERRASVRIKKPIDRFTF
jgi:hypothetical protein